jgi:hypothetical protein
MRKIGEEIIRALYHEWCGSEATVRFYGSIIAKIHKTGAECFIKVYLPDSWGTKTTYNRINTLLSVAVQEPQLKVKQGTPYIRWLNGTTEPFNNGREFPLKYGAIK